jgi:hypothetical protein
MCNNPIPTGTLQWPVRHTWSKSPGFRNSQTKVDFYKTSRYANPGNLKFTFGTTYFQQIDHVFVFQQLQNADLSESRDRELKLMSLFKIKYLFLVNINQHSVNEMEESYDQLQLAESVGSFSSPTLSLSSIIKTVFLILF